MNLSNYLEEALIDHLFRTNTFAKPAAIYVALFTAAPTDAGGGTEVVGGSYARVAVSQLDVEWDAPVAGNGNTKNSNLISFPAPTGAWGTVVAVGIFDAVTGGNLLIHGTLATAKTINGGDPAPQFPAGTLSITLA